MRVTFWASDKPREQILADAFCDGVRQREGDTAEIRSLLPEPELADCDVAVMVGVKSRRLYRMHWDAGIHVIYLDKGYTRHAAEGPVKIWEYWRVALDAHHPTGRLFERQCGPQRWDKLGIALAPWQKNIGGQIVLAGSSQKYHDFYGLSDPTKWARKVIADIRLSDQNARIVYRPKPSWRDAVPIEGTVYSSGDQSIDEVLRGAYCLVTHGSNAVFDAFIRGIPTVVLGDAVTKDMSSLNFTDPWPVVPRLDFRQQWANNLAHFQYTLPEIAKGLAWEWLRPMIYGRVST